MSNVVNIGLKMVATARSESAHNNLGVITTEPLVSGPASERTFTAEM